MRGLEEEKHCGVFVVDRNMRVCMLVGWRCRVGMIHIGDRWAARCRDYDDVDDLSRAMEGEGRGRGQEEYGKGRDRAKEDVMRASKFIYAYPMA